MLPEKIIIKHKDDSNVTTEIKAIQGGGFQAIVTDTTTTGEQPSGDGTTTETITINRTYLSALTPN